MQHLLSPWPITVKVAADYFVTVWGISKNNYIVSFVGEIILLESPTIASEENIEAELPLLYVQHRENDKK